MQQLGRRLFKCERLGLDTNPIIMPIRAFGKEHHRTISGLPLQPCVGGASGPRLMMSSWANEVNIWWIPIYDHSRTSASEESATLEKLRTRKLVAKIVIQVRFNSPFTIRILSLS